MPEKLETVLRLVADGTLTPSRPRRSSTRSRGRSEIAAASATAWRIGSRAVSITRSVGSRTCSVGSSMRSSASPIGWADLVGATCGSGSPSTGGRSSTSGSPIGFVDTALKFVPGIGGDQSDRIREAVDAGVVGPIIDVESSDGDAVLISVE